MITAVINKRYATLYELQTIYGTEDLFNLYEILLVKMYNEEKAYERARKK